MKTISKFNQKIIFGILFFCCMGVASAAYAFRPGMHDGKWRILRHLDLTGDQKAQIDAIFKTYQPVLNDKLDALREARKDQAARLAGIPFDEAQVREAYRAVVPLHEEMFVLRMRMKTEIRALLTDAQIKLLEAKRDCWQEGMRDRAAVGHHKREAWQ